MTDAQFYNAVFPHRSGLTAAENHDIAQERFAYLNGRPGARDLFERAVAEFEKEMRTGGTCIPNGIIAK